VNALAGYDEDSSVVPHSELGDRPSLRARSSYRCRSFAVRLRSAGGTDAVPRVRSAHSEMIDSSSGVVDSSYESLPSLEYMVHRPVKDPSSLSLTMYGAQSVACGSILALLSSDSRSMFSAATWTPAENDGSWEIMLATLRKAFVLANVTPALRTLDRCDA
jgi:hypothetical protein